MGQGNITSILLPLIKVMKNRKLKQFSIFQQIYLFCLLTSISTIYSSLLFLVNLFRLVFCPKCKKRKFGNNGSFNRDQELPLLPITIEWKVQRYYCKKCSSKTFNSFTNTIFHNKELHPVFYLVSYMYQRFPFNIPFIKQQLSEFVLQIHKKGKEVDDGFAISVTMKENHLTDDFLISMRYYLGNCLNEKQKRLGSGLFAILFDNISKVNRISRIARKTIRRGKNELLNQFEQNEVDQRIRKPGGGRKPTIQKYESAILEFVDDYTAGDPMSEKKWIRISLRNITDHLNLEISHVSVGKILKDKNYSLLVNKKTRRTRDKHPKRGAQFEFINASIKQFQKLGIPIIAIDGKKTEKIGWFRQAGKIWIDKNNQFEVYDHDFSNLAEGKLIPYGIYDYNRNEGYIVCGTSLETTEFAVDSLVMWWENRGREIYGNISELGITCDAGKPNSYRGKLFKFLLQTKFVDKFGITVHIMHYAPGDSKYHIIERMLFSQVSLMFRGNPLYSYEKAISLIRNTTTKTGLEVQSILHTKQYQRGLSHTITDAEYRTINIEENDINPEFNYMIQPRTKLGMLLTYIEAEEELIKKEIKKAGSHGYKSQEKGIEEIKQLSYDNCWKYHEITDVVLKESVPRRVDGRRGRPGPDTEMYLEYYFQITYERSKLVEDYIAYLKGNNE